MWHFLGVGRTSGYWDSVGDIRAIEFVRQYVSCIDDHGKEFTSGGKSFW